MCNNCDSKCQGSKVKSHGLILTNKIKGHDDINIQVNKF